MVREQIAEIDHGKWTAPPRVPAPPAVPTIQEAMHSPAE
jgi:hypothetical protein